MKLLLFVKGKLKEGLIKYLLKDRELEKYKNSSVCLNSLTCVS